MRFRKQFYFLKSDNFLARYQMFTAPLFLRERTVGWNELCSVLRDYEPLWIGAIDCILS